MPKELIFEGKTTTEAIDKGLKELKVSKDKVEITVLEQEEKRSFFSILAPRVVKVKMVLKEGDRVVYSKYAGTEIKFEGETYIVIKQNDILAKVEN